MAFVHIWPSFPLLFFYSLVFSFSLFLSSLFSSLFLSFFSPYLSSSLFFSSTSVASLRGNGYKQNEQRGQQQQQQQQHHHDLSLRSGVLEVSGLSGHARLFVLSFFSISKKKEEKNNNNKKKKKTSKNWQKKRMLWKMNQSLQATGFWCRSNRRILNHAWLHLCLVLLEFLAVWKTITAVVEPLMSFCYFLVAFFISNGFIFRLAIRWEILLVFLVD